jgi:hypothetical protein
MSKTTVGDVTYESHASEILNEAEGMTVKKAEERAQVEKILAQGRVDALLLLMDGEEKYMSALAGSVETLNAAENTLSDEIISMRLKLGMMHILPAILKETKKPIEELIPSLRELIK